jgi:hypothetical protein
MAIEITVLIDNVLNMYLRFSKSWSLLNKGIMKGGGIMSIENKAALYI